MCFQIHLLQLSDNQMSKTNREPSFPLLMFTWMIALRVPGPQSCGIAGQREGTISCF